MNYKKISFSGEIPPPTSSHGLVSLQNEPTLVMFGGMQSDYKRRNPTWNYDTGINHLALILETSKFTEVIPGMDSTNSVEKKGVFTNLFRTKKIVPEARERHTLSVLDGNRVLCFGGIGDQKKRFNEVWILSTIPNRYTWSKPKINSKEAPTERYNHSAIVFNESTVVIFGGWDSQSNSNEVWYLTEKGKKEEIFEWKMVHKGGFEDNLPMGRFQHSACVIENKMYIFGGKARDKALNDFWSFDLKTYKWIKIQKNNTPSPRYGHSCCAIGNNILILSGYSPGGSNNNYPSDLHIYDTEQLEWKEIAFKDVIPPGRIGSGCCVMDKDKVFIFGGVVYHNKKFERTNDAYILDTQINKNSKIKDEKLYIGKYQLLRRLGRGAQGIVYLVRGENNQEWALKRLELPLDEEEESMKSDEELLKNSQVFKEVKVCLALKHPNILSIENYFIERNKKLGQTFLDIVMMYCNSGDLDEYLKQKKHTERELLDLCVQFLEGMAYLHEQKVMHRDIKPQNIFILKDEKEDRVQLKIADFGFAKNTQNSIAVSFAGTPHFMSPEMFSNETYDLSSDIWSMGVCLFCILTRNKVRKNHDFKFDQNRNTLDVSFAKSNLVFKDRYLSVIKKCLEKNPEDRAVASKVLSDLKQIEAEMLKLDPSLFEIPVEIKLVEEEKKDLLKIQTQELSGHDSIENSDSTITQDNHDQNSLNVTPGSTPVDSGTPKIFPEEKSTNSPVFEDKPLDIKSWLSSIGMSEYESKFVENGYDDLSVLIEGGVTDEELDAIGVKLAGHKKKLKLKLSQLSKK